VAATVLHLVRAVCCCMVACWALACDRRQHEAASLSRLRAIPAHWRAGVRSRAICCAPASDASAHNMQHDVRAACGMPSADSMQHTAPRKTPHVGKAVHGKAVHGKAVHGMQRETCSMKYATCDMASARAWAQHAATYRVERPEGCNVRCRQIDCKADGSSAQYVLQHRTTGCNIAQHRTTVATSGPGRSCNV
jgi:hypothetical protein